MGDVAYTDVWTDKGKKYGVIEYSREDDMRNAIKELDDTKLDDCYIRLYVQGSSGGSRRDRSRSPSRNRNRDRDRRDRSRDDYDGRDRRGSYSRRSKRSRSRSRGRDRDRYR